MHRQAGRHLKTEYYLEIECLPDEKLFSPSEIVRRKHDKKTDHESYTRMFHSIYQFGVRNGLTLFPDNGKRVPGGKLGMKEDGRAMLRKGERSARWYGKTWKSKLYIEDREAIKLYAQNQLVDTLRLCLDQKRREHEVAKKTGRRIAMKKGLWVAALVAAIVLTAGSIYNYSYLNEGYSVLRSQGPRAAFEYFQNRGESYDNLFGLAWSAYRDGNYEEAEKIAQRVLKSRSLKDQARAWYLIGIIKTGRGDYDEGKDDLLNAVDLYESLGEKTSKRRSLIALARLFILKKDAENATYYLNLADQAYTSPNDSIYLWIRAQIAFIKNDYETALAFSLERERISSSDQSRLAGIYSDIAFYYGLIGDGESCLDYTSRAQGLASEQEDLLHIMYNNLNMYLYLKCSMRDFQHVRDSVMAYAKDKKDMKLLGMIHFIDKFSCPIPQTDPGVPDPPDDPPPGSLIVPQFNRNSNGNPGVPQKRSDPGDAPPPDDPPPGDPGHAPPPSRTDNGHGDPPKDPPPSGGGN